jgi:hypothetical protein
MRISDVILGGFSTLQAAYGVLNWTCLYTYVPDRDFACLDQVERAEFVLRSQ